MNSVYSFCVCVRACVHVRVCVYVCACACVYTVILNPCTSSVTYLKIYICLGTVLLYQINWI